LLDFYSIYFDSQFATVVTAFMANSHRLSFINEDQDENKDQKAFPPFGGNEKEDDQDDLQIDGFICFNASTVQHLTKKDACGASLQFETLKF